MCIIDQLNPYQKKKMAKKVAYDIWELSLKQKNSEVSQEKIKTKDRMKKLIERELKRELSDSYFFSILDLFQRTGNLGNIHLEQTLIEDCLRIVEDSIDEDHRTSSIDD